MFDWFWRWAGRVEDRMGYDFMPIFFFMTWVCPFLTIVSILYILVVT